MTQPAKVLAPADVRRVCMKARDSRHAHRNVVVVLLSFKAGLRAAEIAGITWPMVLTANGRVASSLTVANSIGKNGRGRLVPMHPQLRRAIEDLHRVLGRPEVGPVIPSVQGSHMRPRSIVNLFASFYDELGLKGCSSHSGRRTFITIAARLVTKTGGSLRDVQELAGHSAITTTERYIEGNRDAQRKLVRMM